MLDIERKFLEDNKEALLKEYGGRFLVIRGEEVTGVYSSFNEALQGSALMHGLDNVLIRNPAEGQMQVSVPALTLGILNADFSYSGSRAS